MNDNIVWTENVVLVDADYADSVAFNLIVNFERIIGRRIPQADMARWLDCLVLDGGVRQGEHTTSVVLIHDKERQALNNFVPSHYEQELNGKAFSDHLGEFVLMALPVEQLTTKCDFMTEALQLACSRQEVKRVMVVADERHYAQVSSLLRKLDHDSPEQLDGKRITVFTMEPREGGCFRQEILGFSLMSALGIRGDEIHAS